VERVKLTDRIVELLSAGDAGPVDVTTALGKGPAVREDHRGQGGRRPGQKRAGSR
jgi:hypothetical protein